MDQTPARGIRCQTPRPPDRKPGRALGAQAQLWSEHLESQRRIDFAAFPRLAAFAEIVWTARDRRDTPDLLRRIAGPHDERLEAMGVALTSHEVITLLSFDVSDALTRARRILELSGNHETAETVLAGMSTLHVRGLVKIHAGVAAPTNQGRDVARIFATKRIVTDNIVGAALEHARQAFAADGSRSLTITVWDGDEPTEVCAAKRDAVFSVSPTGRSETGVVHDSLDSAAAALASALSSAD